jgi:hypothetical protein
MPDRVAALESPNSLASLLGSGVSDDSSAEMFPGGGHGEAPAGDFVTRDKAGGPRETGVLLGGLVRCAHIRRRESKHLHRAIDENSLF